MSDVGKWCVQSLNCLAEIGSGSAPLSRKGTFPIMGANGQIGWTDSSNFEVGYLVGRVGAAGAINFVSSPCWASDNTLTVRAKATVCDMSFLGHLLFFLHPEKLATINAQPLITQTNLGGLSTEVPISTAIQHAIAAILDSIDDAIRQTKAVIAKLRQVKAGMLHDLLRRGLDGNGELRDPSRHPEQFKDSPLGRIPKEWEIKGLLETAPIVEGQVDPTVHPFADFILVAPDHIESGTGRLLDSQTARQQAAISGKYRFLSGDVVYSKIRPYLRKVWLATFEGICSADMYPFRPGTEVDSRFLLMTLLSERFSRFATSVSERSGFPKINRTELSSFRFALPLKKEQERIAQAVQSIETKLLAEQVCKDKLISLKHGLMHDLLTGTVRVPANLLEATA